MANTTDTKVHVKDADIESARISPPEQGGDDTARAAVPDSALLNTGFDVRARLEDLRGWAAEWEVRKGELDALLWPLDIHLDADRDYGRQLAGVRRREQMILVKRPLELSKESFADDSVDAYGDLRNHLSRQFGKLSRKERVLWLTNFLLLLTPDMRNVVGRIQKTRSHLAFGQGRCFMLAAPSGMGKSTLLNFIVLASQAGVANGYNRVPIVMVDASVTQHTAKGLLRRIISEYGSVTLKKYDEQDLLDMLAILVPRCKTELVIVDEVQHLKTYLTRRRLLEISNLTTNVPILISAVNPAEIGEEDPEIRGRWAKKDTIELNAYIDGQLQGLLNFIELILPFPESSNLTKRVLPDGEPGPAAFIQEHTGGILKRIMILLVDAIAIAMQAGAASLELDYIVQAAAQRNIPDIEKVDFFAVLDGMKKNVA